MRRLLACSVMMICLMVCCHSEAMAVGYNQPIVTDSRIKTLVYNPNEVFRIVTNYGFQSNIEFSPNERIMTISLGDQAAWQIIPSENTLFIRALIEVAHSNMTVITDKRKYQFDLFARSLADVPDEELSYVVRFYYPDDNFDTRVESSTPAYSSPAASFPSAPADPSALNYRYSLSGPQNIAPVRVYDDGRSTYFQFAQSNFRPQIFMVNSAGRESPVNGYAQGDTIVVDAIGGNFTIRSGSDTVCVFNENIPQNNGGRP